MHVDTEQRLSLPGAALSLTEFISLIAFMMGVTALNPVIGALAGLNSMLLWSSQ